MEKDKFFDWETGRAVAIGAVGGLSTSFDNVVARIIAVVTAAILIIKLYRMLKSKRSE